MGGERKQKRREVTNKNRTKRELKKIDREDEGINEEEKVRRRKTGKKKDN